METRTKLQALYYDEVIRMHYSLGYGSKRIEKILPIGHTTVDRWLAIFASENDLKSIQMPKLKPQKQLALANTSVLAEKSQEEEISRLQAQLKHEKMRSDAFEEMINLAESKFNIAIRKKAGAKQ